MRKKIQGKKLQEKCQTISQQTSIVLAVPKGRILKEVKPLLRKIGIVPESAFDDDGTRQLKFKTNSDTFEIICVRSFDVATFVAFGVAHLGIAGNDVLEEFDYPEIYTPVNLNIGKCRLSVAKSMHGGNQEDAEMASHIRVATKYPNLTKKYFETRNMGAEIIKLSGAVELASSMGLCSCIVDLVSSGKTLRENGLREVESFLDVTSRLIVNRTAFKTRSEEIQMWINKFRDGIYV